MNPMQQLQSSEQDKWVKLARAVVALSVLVWIVMVAILLLAPSPSQCPDWHLKNAHSTSLWILLLGLGGPLNAFGCLIAVRWNQPVQRVTRNEADTHSLAMPAPYFLVRLSVLNSVVAQIPLFFLLTKCTPFLGPGG